MYVIVHVHSLHTCMYETINRSLSWIPTKILHCYYRQSPEDMLCVERCLLSCLVPVNLKPQERMERMINVYATLEDENANK